MKFKGNMPLLINMYGLKKKKTMAARQAFWELKLPHIKVHAYCHNFCPVRQEARQWNALVIKIT